MILFAHTKFGLVRIQGSRVKRGGGGIRPPPQSERVFQIPVQIGLKSSKRAWNLQFCHSDKISDRLNQVLRGLYGYKVSFDSDK